MFKFHITPAPLLATFTTFHVVPYGFTWWQNQPPQCQKTGPKPTEAGQKMKSPVDLGYEETAVPHSGPPPLRNILSGNILVTNAFLIASKRRIH
jgi:hypothetical protein